MSDKLRTFIAIDLASPLRQSLAHLQGQLKKTGADVRWVKPEQIHLTLKFLGDTPVEKIADIQTILEETLQNMPSFPINLQSLGAFPKIDSPQIIWVGIQTGDQLIAQLAQSIDEKLKPLGFPEETKKFSAHITLGRVKSSFIALPSPNKNVKSPSLINNEDWRFNVRKEKVNNRLALVKAIKAAGPLEGLFQKITEVTFYKSTLTAQGPVYEILHKVGLDQTHK